MGKSKSNMEGPYQLVTCQVAQSGPLRSLSFGPWAGEILTGSQGDTPCVRRWQLSGDLESFVEVGSPLYHDHWVTAITFLPPNESHPIYPKGCIITGCMDTMIRVFDADGTLSQTLVGHSKGVISFSWTPLGALLSGGWDGLAILWDLTSSAPVMRFGPHENGVSVLGLPNGRVATTSTGEAVDGKPAHFRLRFWDAFTGTQVGNTVEDHDGPIRSIMYVPLTQGLATTSNDGTMMLRSLDGEGLESLSHPIQDDGSRPMVLNCAVLAGTGLVSCAEDGSVCVWQGADLLQTVQHPNTVWAVLPFLNDTAGASFITVGHDGLLRLFSRDPTLAALPRVQRMTTDFVQEVLLAQQARHQGPSAEEIAAAPKWEQRAQHAGRKEDDVMVFNQDGKLIAAQWSSGSWIVVGEVTSSGDGGTVDGVHYDHVYPVEMDTSTGARAMKLGYNNGENPFVAAQRFLNANEMDQNYLQQVADWILKQNQSSVPTLGAPMGTPTAPRPPAPRVFSHSITGYEAFDELPSGSQKVMAKIRDGHRQHSVHLSEDQLSLLEATLTTLSDAARAHSSTLSPTLLGVLSIMLQWPLDNRFIAFDILRLVAMHPHGCEILAGSPFFRTILQHTINLLNLAGAPHSSILMACRFVANMLKSEALKRVFCTNFLNECRELLYASMGYAAYGNKLVRLASVTVTFNLMAALKLSANSTRGVVTVDMLQTAARRAVQLLQVETDSALAAQRATQVLGTLFLTERDTVAPVAAEAAAALVAAGPAWVTRGQTDLAACIDEALRVVL